MTTISLKIPTTLEQRLANLARKRGTSRSEVVRSALERLVEDEDVRPGSCLALMSDLVGSVDGPSDLSYNKKRLEGFGR